MIYLFTDFSSQSLKKGNARCAHSNSLRSLLSVFPCGSPLALREKRQRTFGAPTRFTPCCRIFHADRFALWENPQRSLRSLQLTAFVARPAATLGDLRIFPGFSRLGTHRSVLPCGSPMALRAGWRHSRCIRSSAAESNGR